jgi:hypothetical protein
MTTHGIRKTCPNGHVFYKSSDCPTCPACEAERKPQAGWLSTLSAPARRALENAGIVSIEQVAKYSRAELLSLHGLGPSSIPKLEVALSAKGLSFRADSFSH